MATDTSRGYDLFFDDFHGDTIADELATSSDTGTITVGTPTDASCLRMDNSNDGNNDMCEVDIGAVYFRAQDGHCWMEARFRIEAATTVAVNVGFNDETLEDANTLPAELSTATFTVNAGTWIGFVADTNATNDYYHAYWIDDSVGSSTAIATLKSTVPIAALKWTTARIDLWDNGSGNQVRAEFMISDEDGHSWQYVNNSTIDRDCALTPHVAIENRTTTGRYLDLDYLEAGKSRVSTGS